MRNEGSVFALLVCVVSGYLGTSVIAWVSWILGIVFVLK